MIFFSAFLPTRSTSSVGLGVDQNNALVGLKIIIAKVVVNTVAYDVDVAEL